MNTTTNSNEPSTTTTTSPEPEAIPQAAPEIQAPSQEAKGRMSSGRATSDIGAFRTLALAIPFYGVAVLAAKAAPPSAREILLERGWPPHATMALACFALAILLMKAVGLRRQRRAFTLELLPEGEPRIAPEAATRLVDHVSSIRDLRGTRTFLVDRVVRVLSQYAAHGDVAEASAVNDAEAEANAASVAASFSMLKLAVWAMPILGLIGTVVGLSGAVGAFSHAMSGAEQLDTIKDSLRQVTTGLAVAFDATFVALVASILVMLPMTWLQKAEDKLVNDVDDYCVTNILARLGGRDQAADATAEKAPAAVLVHDALEMRKIVVETIAQPLAEMLSANARVMDRMSEDRGAIVGAQGELMAQLSAFAATLKQTAPVMERAGAQLERATAVMGPNAERVATELGRATAVMGSSVDRMATELGRATDRMGTSVDRVLAELDKSTNAVGPSMDRAVTQLDKTTAQATQGMERAVTQLERATAQVQERVAPSVERAAGQIERATAGLGASVERAVTQLEASAAVADQAASAAEHAQDQLSRELGASRQLLSLLAAGLNAGDASRASPRHANGTNGANGANAVRGA